MHTFIAVFLLAVQSFCDGVPRNKYPVLHIPDDVVVNGGFMYDEGDEEKRALCTENEKDKQSSCPYWEAKGYCDQGHIYHDFMMDNCYASCGYCELPPTPPPAVDKIACLQAHNAKRDIHGASSLVWDDTLEQHAKEWADHLLSEGKGLKHATQTGEGENLYWGKTSSHRTCEDAMNSWYDKEEKLYDYNNPGFSPETGHFTQVVWKATTAVGVALAANKSEDGWIETYIVARYSPQGNIRGRFAENVERPQ